MNAPTEDPLVAAEEALDRGDWAGALVHLDRQGPSPADAAHLVLRARAAYGAGDLEGAVGAWEQLHLLRVAEGDEAAAAHAAAMVAMYLMMDTGLMAPVRAWLRRADRLLADLDETPAHALVAMVRGYERFMSGDPVAAGENARSAIELGTRHDVQPAVVMGRVATARLTILAGQVEEGLDLLDDLAVLLLSGAVDPLTTGMALCELICAMQGLARYDRAAEWTRAMEQWRQGTAFGGINGRCRVHRAEMLRLSGPCDEAEAEAMAACDELRPWMRREFGWPLAELGNIRLRRGDLAGAEDAFLAAHGNAWTAQPGLALCRLAQGDAATAATLVADALEHPFDVPSKERPPFGDLCRAPLLDAQVEIAAARGDAGTARAAADELRSIAEDFDSPALRAAAALSDGRAALLEGRPERAAADCETALALWAEVGAPFEVAVARLVLAEALEQLGRDERAAVECRAAAAAFEQFGAPWWADRARRRSSGDDGHRPSGSPVNRRATFTCEGDTRTVAFAGVTVHLHDLKGLRYLARLLAEPNREFHVLDLVNTERGPLPTGGPPDDDLSASDGGDAGVLLDETAREAYRRRLQEIEEDIDEATSANDLGRIAQAENDRQYLITELARAVGLDGRPRRSGDTVERARTSVTRALRYALARIGEHHPALGAHLDRSLRTGTYCAYFPDANAAVEWEV